MRIAFTILDITAGGGMERTTSLLANTFALQEHQVTIVSVFKADKAPLYDIDAGVNIVYLISEKYTHKNSISQNACLYLRAIQKLKRYYHANSYDAIIGQAFLCNMFLWISGNAKKSFACEHFKYEMYNKPIRRFRNWFYKKFRCVVVLTEADAKKYERCNVNVQTIPNMLPYKTIQDISVQYRRKRLISVGRLQYEKGYDLLLLAVKNVFQKHPDWQLDIYGEGSERENLEIMRNKLELKSNIHLPGFSYNIQEEYLTSSIYIMSSRHEGLPMVLLEAMACGLPIISFNCSGRCGSFK